MECTFPLFRWKALLINYRGAFATFATEGMYFVNLDLELTVAATGFSKAFPGITPHLLTLASNFKMPFYRDVALALGISSVSKRSCINILKSGPGHSITIVIGGAAESLSAHPGTADLTLRRRSVVLLTVYFVFSTFLLLDSASSRLPFSMGTSSSGAYPEVANKFCRADLVPVFSFGENDIYQQMPNERGTAVFTIQKKFQSMFGFTLPLFHGRGMLNCICLSSTASL